MFKFLSRKDEWKRQLGVMFISKHGDEEVIHYFFKKENSVMEKLKSHTIAPIHGVGLRKVKVKVTLSCPTLSDPMDCIWNSPGQNTGVGRLSLLQEIFPPRN